MSVIATMNVGSNGATSKGGSSTGLSSAIDRSAFLALHRSAGAYILGRNSYSVESYKKSKVPIYILTRTPHSSLHINENLFEIDVSRGLADAMRKITRTVPSPIIVEAGIGLLLALVEDGCIDELHLSFSPKEGDGHYLETETLLSNFDVMSDEEIDSTRLLKCRYKGDSAYGEDNS
jgi:riboflavin biosynthesis pyrimidine reductase